MQNIPTPALLTATLLALTGGLQAAPEATDTPPDPPCVYKTIDISNPAFAGQPFKNPDEINFVDAKSVANLEVGFTKPEETKIAGCGVKLRSYNGKLVGPTLRVKAGGTLNINVTNKLGSSVPSGVDVCYNPSNAFGGSPLPDNFNCTNLHTHGLHVSPKGFADNILAVIPPVPSTDKDNPNPRPIKIPLPGNHAPGTHWYHPHIHGSTGIQVASGMEGAIIVEDDPAKTPKSILEANKHEKIFMLQSIPYDDKGEINDFLSLGDDRAFVRNRYLMVNGQIAPVLTMQPGEVQRWRFIDSSFDRNIQLTLDKHDLHEIAVDGIYLPQVDTWVNNWEQKDYCCTGKWDQEYTFKLKRQAVELIPGSRSDVLVRANSKPGRYPLMASTYISGRLDPSIASYTENVVAWVDVAGTAAADTGLPTNEEMKQLQPYAKIENKDVQHNQIATFNRDQPAGGNDGGIPCKPVEDNTPCYPVAFQVNGRSFSADAPRILELDGTDTWMVSSADVARNHVFHIHTNAFQTTRTDPLGYPETLWRDSILVKYGEPQTIMTRYQDFDGKTVMHCHLLSHEDMGMMELIQFAKKKPVVDSTAGHAGH